MRRGLLFAGLPSVLPSSQHERDGIRFDRGTLLLSGARFRFLANASVPADGSPTAPTAAHGDAPFPGAVFDPRVAAFRAPAYLFPKLVHHTRGQKPSPVDFKVDKWVPRTAIGKTLRSYQHAALAAWNQAQWRGVVVLPTGAGKTHVALAAVAGLGVPTLVVVPTRVLLCQWQLRAQACFPGEPIGVLGDGQRSLQSITVATYESALRHMPRIGNRFALLVVDEAHHFSHGQRTELLEMSTAPFRLGLTATPPESPIASDTLAELVGPICFETTVNDLRGSYLADFDHSRVSVHLTEEEQRCYERHIRCFRQARKMASWGAGELPWPVLIARLQALPGGARAISSFRIAEQLVSYPAAKANMLRRLLDSFQARRVLCFTADNRTAYQVARDHLLWPITCDIGRPEREEAMNLFREGKLRGLVSARVLNEGYDVPDADVAIIISAKLGVREHVQRMGRVLRPRPGKRAAIVELVCHGTLETRRAQRRRLPHTRSGGDGRAK